MPELSELSELKQRFDAYASHYETWYERMRAAKKYYDLDFGADIVKPPDTPERIPPTARTRVETAVIEMVTDTPIVRRRRAGHTQQQDAHDDDIEAALQAFLLDREEYLATPVLHEAAKYQMGWGGAVIFAGPFFNLAEKIIWFDAYNPLTVYMEPGASPREGFIHIEMTAAELEQLASESPIGEWEREHRKPTDKVTLVQWYSYRDEKGEYAAWLKDEAEFLVAPRPSGYPYLPLDIVYSGWGQRGIGTTPEDAAVPMLNKGAQTLIVNEAEMFTVMAAAAGQQVWGRYRKPQGVVLPQNFTISTLPNSVTEMPPEIEPLETPGLSPEVSRHFDLVESLIDDALFSRVLAGERQPGVGTATGLTLLASRARRRFYPPIRLLQAGLSRVLLKVGLLVHHLNETHVQDSFEWRGCELADKLYHDDYTVEVQLLSEDEEERRIKRAEGVALDGKIPRRIIWQDYYGIENYAEAFEDYVFEKLVDSDAFLNSLVQEYGLRAQAKKVEEGRERQEQLGGRVAMDEMAGMYRAARQGFVPTQTGTPEGVAQAVQQPRQLGV